MPARRAGERGLSLVEALVATAVMSVAIVIALGLYDASRKAFAKGENATEQQESVRIAFDELSADLRMLGYDVNPDGSPTRPDEQLEGALDHAIVFRSDRDAGIGRELTPETAPAGVCRRIDRQRSSHVLSKPDGTG
jgi:type II secretory pathway component PulJ